MTITSRLEGLETHVAIKAPCRAATTANISLVGIQTVDGVSLASGDRVLVKDQTDATENGIYAANSGDWERAQDFNGTRDVVGGTFVKVTTGSVNADSYWSVSGSGPVVPGADELTFAASSGNVTLQENLAASSGSSFVGFSHAATYGGGTIGHHAKNHVSVTDAPYSAVGDGATNNSSAFTNSIATERKVYVPAGTYLVSNATLLSGTTIQGDGPGLTILKPTAAGVSGVLDADSGSSSAYLENITVRDLTIEGYVSTASFSEFVHLVRLNGVKNALFERVTFKGFQGDGAYIGSGNTAGQERHNVNVTFRDCVFDGVNNDNRNAISCIDVDGLTVENCYFVNCTRSNMPGPIDCEPDTDSYHVIKNITIRNNRFKACGGNVAEIGVLVNSSISTTPVNVLVEGNVSESRANSGALFFFKANRTPTSTSARNNVQVMHNVVTNGQALCYIYDGKGIQVRGNHGSDLGSSSFFGNTGATDFARDITYSENALVRGGSVSGNGLAIFNATNIVIKDSRFDDCGTGTVGSSNAIDFNTGASSGVRLSGLEFVSPTSKTLVAVQKEAGHTLTTASTYYENLTLNGLANSLTALQSGQVLTGSATYDPASLADGAGATTTVTVTGAAVGDYCSASFSNDLQGITFTSWVSASNTVSVRFQNESGGVLDLASGTIRARVVKA